MKRRLDFVAIRNCEMREAHKKTVQHLRSQINLQQTHQIKYLNQDVTRKKLSITNLGNKIKDLKRKFSKSEAGKTIINLETSLRNERRNLKRAKQQRKDTKNLSKPDSEVLKLRHDIKMKNERIVELENENIELKEQQSNPTMSHLQKEGKSYPVDLRMLIYDAIVNGVPTNNISKLLAQFGKRCGIEFGNIPHRSTIEYMTRELGVVSNFQAADLLMTNENVTLGFDATTQEGVHVNSVHITTKDKCQVLAVDQLPGGTAEDYELHITETLDSIVETYCGFHDTSDFETTRKTFISKIANTMTDRAAVNHSTIQRLELNWRKNLNELNCHLHPLDTIASSVRTSLKASEPTPIEKKLFGTESMAHQLILAFNKLRYKDGRGDPKGFANALQNAGLPKGLLPRYRGNRLHIMFDIAGKLHAHRPFFLKFLSEGTVTCGGLQTAILHDYQSPVSQLQLQVLGLLGKLLSGPWMEKFYRSATAQISHVDGISVVKQLLQVLKDFADRPFETLTTTVNFFGSPLPIDDTVRNSLQTNQVDETTFRATMKTCLLSVIAVIERQYSRYFSTNLTEQLRLETESARSHNIDAETIMGMFSAAASRAPNATLSFISSKIRAQKNNVVDYLDSLPADTRDKLIQIATTLGRKDTIKKRRRTADVHHEITKRLESKMQKKKTLERGKLERKLKACAITDLEKEFVDLDYTTLAVVRDILSDKAVGRQICHIWYDDVTHQKTMYFGKLEKTLRKAGGTYRVGYWSDGETYEQDAEDYDISKYALAADAICGDLTVL